MDFFFRFYWGTVCYKTVNDIVSKTIFQNHNHYQSANIPKLVSHGPFPTTCIFLPFDKLSFVRQLWGYPLAIYFSLTMFLSSPYMREIIFLLVPLLMNFRYKWVLKCVGEGNLLNCMLYVCMYELNSNSQKNKKFLISATYSTIECPMI